MCRDMDASTTEVMALSEVFVFVFFFCKPLVAGDQKASLANFLCWAAHSGI